jgi:ribosomal protein L20
MTEQTRSTVPEAIPESRAPRFAELDAQIQAETEGRQDRPQRKRRPRRPSTSRLPAAVRKEVTRFARGLNRQHGQQFRADPKLKDRVTRFLRSLLLPRARRRGRPGIPSVTKALALLKKYRRKHPGDKPANIWKRVYPETIPNHAGMNDHQRRHAQEVLRERVRWRLRDRKRRARKVRPENS